MDFKMAKNSSLPAPLSIFDGDAGLAQNSEGVTIKSLIINILSGIVLFVVQVTIWQLLKSLPRLKGLYQPKTYLVPLSQRWSVPSNNPFKWFFSLWQSPDKEVIAKCGLDTYLFLRYLSMLLKLFIPMAFLILPILLPLNKIDGAENRTYRVGEEMRNFNISGLDAFSWQNIPPTHTSRYWAHLVLAIIVIVYASWMFWHETLVFIRLRQDWLSSPQHRLKSSSSTILVMGIPLKWDTMEALDQLYDVFPGGIHRIWVNRNYSDLAAKVQRRDKLINLLEEAELQLIRASSKRHKDNVEKDKRDKERSDKKQNIRNKKKTNPDQFEDDVFTVGTPEPEDEDDTSPLEGTFEKRHRQQQQQRASASSEPNPWTDSSPARARAGSTQSDTEIFDPAYGSDADGQALWMKYAKKRDRHTIRIFRFGWTWMTTVPLWSIIFVPFSKSVDTIYYCRREIATLTYEIDREAEHLDKYPLLNSAFIQFNSQIAAHMACSLLSHHTPGKMAPRYLEVAPSDINWNCISLKWWEKYLWELFVFITFICILIIWGIPVTFTGFLSQLGSLRFEISWLAPFRNVSSGVISILSGPLPPIILQLLVTALVPTMIRALCALIAPTSNIRELYVQAYYFAFLFIELVLIVSISSGISIIIPQVIKNPTIVPEILARNLPKASNYFFNYMILHALSISASALLQLPRLLNTGWRHWLVGGTPRQLFNWHTSLPHHNWGSFFPFYTVFAVIGLIYCIISPLILVFDVVMFSLFWLAHRNNSFYVTRQLNETGGLLYARAIQQLFTGLYFMEAALIGLFFLVRDSQNKPTAAPQAIIMIVMLVLTAIFHFLMNQNLAPYFEYLPVTLEDDAAERDNALRIRMEERQSLVQSGQLPAISVIPDHVLEPGASSPSPWNDATRQASIDSQRSRDLVPPPDYSKAPTVGGVSEDLEGSTSNADIVEPSRPRKKSLARFFAIRRHTSNSTNATLTRNPSTVTATVTSSLTKKPGRSVGKGVSAGEKTDNSVEAQLHKDPIAMIMTEYNDKLEDISREDIDALTQIAYTHPATHPYKRVIWIPDDELGVSKDEIQRTADFSKFVSMDNRWATLEGKKLKVAISHPPPDFSEFWLVEKEL